ncbi:DUF1080 domain-containing protein [Candidatus Sumerlaeota bacterium]|nr:DUF1080 domain-containing protein [Candidatus Sumerlaeota bacterium]
MLRNSVLMQGNLFMAVTLFAVLGATHYFAESELQSTDSKRERKPEIDADQKTGEWLELFNGKDLTGWKANRKPDSFRVEDGLLRAQAAGGSSHLFYVGDSPEGEYFKFKDFELEIVARCEPESNSGVFFHTDWKQKENSSALYSGYEVQLNNGKQDPRKTGGLYAIADLDESPVDETQWFTLNLLVQGKRITVKIDGKTVVDYTEAEKPQRPKEREGRLLKPEGGAIALQAHDPKSVFYFKSVKIRTLDSADQQ